MPDFERVLGVVVDGLILCIHLKELLLTRLEVCVRSVVAVVLRCPSHKGGVRIGVGGRVCTRIVSSVVWGRSCLVSVSCTVFVCPLQIAVGKGNSCKHNQC